MPDIVEINFEGVKSQEVLTILNSSNRTAFIFGLKVKPTINASVILCSLIDSCKSSYHIRLGNREESRIIICKYRNDLAHNCTTGLKL